MYALINKGDGSFYRSAVFGKYDYPDSNDFSKEHFLVLNEEKTGLIEYPYFLPGITEICKIVLITDKNTDDWTLSDDGTGGVSWLPKEKAQEYIREGTPTEILDMCLEYDSRNPFKNWEQVESEKDAVNLSWLAGEFHDAFVQKLNPIPNGLRILLGGIWGCQIEFIFKNDVSFNNNGGLFSDEMVPYWYSGSVVFRDGYIYLVDDEIGESENINDFSWIRGKELFYKVIPQNFHIDYYISVSK